MSTTKSASSAGAKKQKTVAKKRLPRLSNSMITLIAREYYRAVMPAKRSHRTMIWVAFFVVWGVLVVQFMYPLDRAVPFASIGADRVALAAHDDLANRLTEKFNATKVSLKAVDKQATYPLKSAGAELNTEQLIAQLVDYPFWQRFIPLSILWQMPKVEYADVYYTDTVLKRFSGERSKELSSVPMNARLAIKDGTLVATPEKTGYEVSSDHIHTVMSSAQLPLGKVTQIVVQSKNIPAERTMKEFSVIKNRAEQALNRPVTIIAGGVEFSPTDTERASWLILDTNTAGGPSLRVDSEKANTYISDMNKQVGDEAGQTDISIVNGRETGRETGKVGRKIDSGVLVEQLSQFILEGKGTARITAQFVTVQPSIIYNSKYTATQDGLRAYVTEQGRTKNVRIDIRQIDGGGWTASTRAEESTVSASTYKLFVSLMLFDKMKRGETSWSDPMLDTTVSTCFDRMTIASTNPCAEKWLAQWGRPVVNSFLYDRGFSTGTTFTSTIANHTTAADLSRYMVGLNSGSIVEEPYRSRLLHSLSVHPYRYGIPTGSKGKVYDKVGFLWDYVHDTAIVKHPQGTYVMTVMTKGQSYVAIANITREVERIMYP